MLLKDKVAILYGGGGHIGSNVARAFAREGAHVVLTGRGLAKLDSVAREIVAVGGRVETSQLNASDQQAVEDHFHSVASRHGTVDISFNMIGLADVQGKALTELSLEEFVRPVAIAAHAHFITATAAARHMTLRGRGVILALTATPARLALPLVGGFASACSAIEALLRTLAAEVGPRGVRVCWLYSAGSPESFGPADALDVHGRPAGLSDATYLDTLKQATLLKRLPRLSEVADMAAMIASDRASAMTGAAANITCGQGVD